MVEKICIYKGRLGEEKKIDELDGMDIVKFNRLPVRKDLIGITPDEPWDEYSSDVYVVKQVLMDYTTGTYSIFVEEYDWE